MEVMDMGTMLTLATVSTTPFHPGFIDLPFFYPLLPLWNVFEKRINHIADLDLSFFFLKLSHFSYIVIFYYYFF